MAKTPTDLAGIVLPDGCPGVFILDPKAAKAAGLDSNVVVLPAGGVTVKAHTRSKDEGGGTYNVLSAGKGKFGIVAGTARMSAWVKHVNAVAKLRKDEDDDTRQVF